MSIQNDLTKVEFDLEQILVKDIDTNEEKTVWKIDNEYIDRPVRGDTPEEALEFLADCIKSDEGRNQIDLDEISE